MHRGMQVSWRPFPTRALIIFAAPEGSFAHDGTKPQRINDNSRTGSFGCWQMTGIGCVGAMLKRGFQSSSHGEVSKYSSINSFLRDNR